VFGTADATTALVLIALSIALLLGLLSYHRPGRGHVRLGIGFLILATGIALLWHAGAEPGAGTALAFLLVSLTVMLVLLTYQSRRWAHAVWWMGVLLFLLTLPFVGAGRADLGLFCLVAGPGLLMLVATLHPEVPARYSRLGVSDGGSLTVEDLATERQRYTRLATTVTMVALVGVWLGGGVPRTEVTAAPPPMVVDEAAAAQGAELFNRFGCAACHSVTGQAGVGPSLLGLGNKRERMTDGSVVLADEEYIRQSIVQPDARTVNGYSPGVMAAGIAANQAEINQPNNLRALVEYIKSLR
jgi:cytochrome c oxidase subunit 2